MSNICKTVTAEFVKMQIVLNFLTITLYKHVCYETLFGLMVDIGCHECYLNPLRWHNNVVMLQWRIRCWKDREYKEGDTVSGLCRRLPEITEAVYC